MPEQNLSSLFATLYFQELQELNIRATRFKLLKFVADEKIKQNENLPKEISDEAIAVSQEIKFYVNLLFFKVLSVAQKGDVPPEQLKKLKELRDKLLVQVSDGDLEEFVIMINRFFAMVIETKLGYSPQSMVQGLG
jgi:hypothetical protein